MDPDMYRVKVLKYLNPHLLWVEVMNKADEIVFEQIGIYGILPMDTVIKIEVNSLKSKRTDVWMQAACAVMKNTLADADEIWFIPIHIDRRSSIFNNNIHKYGDIIVKKSNGEEKHMSKELKKSKFAVCDIPQFHQELSLGRIQTKPTETEARDVIKHLRDHYIDTHSSTPWDMWVKRHPYIYHIMQKIDILAEINMHKGETTRKQITRLKEIQNKLNDLDLCAEIDEESVGRGKIRHSNKSPLSKLKLLKRKLRMVEEKLKYDDTSSVADSTEPESDLNTSKKTVNSFLSSTNSDTSLNESLPEIEKSYIKNHKKDTKNLEKKIETLIDESQNYAQISMKAQKSMREEPSMTIRLAYGPPGLELGKLAVKVVPRLQELSKTDTESKDANDNIEKGIKEERDMAVNNDDNNEMGTEKGLSEDYKPKTKLLKSAFLQRKLKLHKDNVNAQVDPPTSGNNTFEEPVQNSKVNEVSDDESITDLIERLNIKNTTKRVPKKEVDRQYLDFRELPKINANPFRNIDGSNSVFVDKLISTVLMVHTKKNNRIQPCSNIRDVPFTTEIHIVLRNMGIKAPTRIQTVSWTTILRGHSVFMIGPLGCGKTMGYLPAVCRLTSDYRKQNPDNVYPTAIIVCATAKSVTEVEKNSKMLFGLEERVLACYAGMNELSITTSLLNGCDLLICTPPILARLLQAELGVDLRALATFVIDDCERIAEVYSDEIKLALYEVKKVLKRRSSKEMKVQFVVASRVWCKFLESLARKVPDTVVCIGSFQECVLYSQTRMSVDFVKNDNKINAVVQFLEEVEGPKRTVIVCRHDDEVELLENTLTKLNRVVFACNNTMTIHDLYNLNVAWGKYDEPTRGPILVCCDGNLVHLNVTDAHYLLHYSMPLLFSTFSKRFSVLNDNYPSIFTDDGQKLKVKVLLEDANAEQLPKILNFVKRCTNNVPDALNDVANEVLVHRDTRKAKELVPICDTMLSFGHCADFWNCRERHAVFKDYDKPKEWMPTEGHINFKILHYHSADLYSVRLLSNTVKGNTKKYPQTYSTLSLKMGMYFSKEMNRRLHGTPKVGDVCAVSVKLDFFVRCQVVKILDNYRNGNPKHLLVRLIDEEKYERTKDVHLYYLPDELKEVQTYAAQVRLANIRPQDKDVTYSDLAKNQLKKITDTDEDLYMRGQIVLVVGNCVFVDPLEACQDFSSLNGTVVRYNFKQELLKAHAEPNPDHIATLKKTV
ncbi:hypothetical protein O3G_MSEX003776 [Manduca sexta]|uniref:RNA helicase n=1 Tax=Manduca sexta TaxID=7130 RepID=A0A922CGD4_MANSE|nr:hypothetical protein O3G_MSEX003776 [Manduca sexta]